MQNCCRPVIKNEHDVIILLIPELLIPAKFHPSKIYFFLYSLCIKTCKNKKFRDHVCSGEKIRD
jgi:hypothetical protein